MTIQKLLHPCHHCLLMAVKPFQVAPFGDENSYYDKKLGDNVHATLKLFASYSCVRKCTAISYGAKCKQWLSLYVPCLGTVCT